MDVDRISSLPDSIRELILTFMPLRDAARASILSTSWRNMWMNLPTLVFDETFFHGSSIEKMMLDLFRVLMLHRGPLRELSLSNLVPEEQHIDQIMLFLQDKGVESLTIKTNGHKLSSSLFSSPSFTRHMKSLHLSGCRFPISSSTLSFEQFGMLTVLELRNVKLMDDSLTTLWSFRCRLLSALTLDGFGGHSQRPSILIEAPRLEYFNFVGNFCCLHLKDASCLKKAILHKEATFPVDRKAESILKLWGGLAAVESLSVSGHFCRYFTLSRAKSMLFLKNNGENSEFVSHLIQWEMLRDMTFDDICLSRRGHSWFLLHILRSSPNLQRLIIQMTKAMDASRLGNSVGVGTLQSWIEDEDGFSVYGLRRLKRVEVKNLKGTRHEITWIRWLLNYSPALDEMEIMLSDTLSGMETISILKELNGLRRSSAIARIIID